MMSDHQVFYGERPISFSVRSRSDIAHKVAIHVQPDRRVIVDAPPHTPIAEVKKALLKRARWVTSQLADLDAANLYALPRQYVSGETHWYLGKRYLLKVRRTQETGAQTRLLRGRLEVSVPQTEPLMIREALKHWYQARAQDVFARRLAELCDKLKWVRSPPSWQIRRMSKQWGSCSPKGKLSLNPHLVKASRACIDYVIVHELCHLQHHNHSKSFYRLLEQALPDWKETKLRLDSMAELLLTC